MHGCRIDTNKKLGAIKKIRQFWPAGFAKCAERPFPEFPTQPLGFGYLFVIWAGTNDNCWEMSKEIFPHLEPAISIPTFESLTRTNMKDAKQIQG